MWYQISHDLDKGKARGCLKWQLTICDGIYISLYLVDAVCGIFHIRSVLLVSADSLESNDWNSVKQPFEASLEKYFCGNYGKLQ